MPVSLNDLARRNIVLGGLAMGGLALAGCSTEERRGSFGGTNTVMAGPDERKTAAMTVYRDPSCGCCEKWAALARDAGYQVSVLDDPDMASVKRKLGVPAQLSSCHTAVVGDFVVEGHVPLEQVGRLLRERPEGIRGIAVPGMPIGSPGMESPDGAKEPFQVMAFDRAGRTSVFA